MGQSNVNLTALIGSRICHDLISPIGAINNGLELLNMSGGGDGPEMELISESVGNASARIRFFRMAYGAAGAQPVGRAEVVSILNDNMKGGRLDVAYGPLDPQPRWAVRMAFLGLQCFETAMPYGGRVEISCAADSWSFTGTAEKFGFDADLWARLGTGDAEDLAPAHVQFALLHHHAEDAGRRVQYAMETDRLRLSF
ncbi:histidine phosphotransferase family protein [Tateyamaria sp. SN6-1]|uniref:histidine phosphotransferase family protein n=1 Tax=Tateyamaria sp. SN6-1 TaxID=3092148 RepID=UPI0039F58766